MHVGFSCAWGVWARLPTHAAGLASLPALMSVLSPCSGEAGGARVCRPGRGRPAGLRDGDTRASAASLAPATCSGLLPCSRGTLGALSRGWEDLTHRASMSQAVLQS